MTIKIHHNTEKKANRLGFTLEARDNLVVARKLEGSDHVIGVGQYRQRSAGPTQNNPLPLPQSGSVVKMRYKKQYGKDASCGDEMAKAVNAYIRTSEGIDIVALRQVAIDNGLDFDGRWGHLNIGQQSMSVRNCFRGMLRRGDRDVVVGDLTFKAEEQDEEEAA